MTRAVAFLSEKQGTILKTMMALIMLLFIGIMVAVYVISKRANPVILDEHGKPLTAATDRQN